MLADPQTITVNAVAKSVSRTAQEGRKGTFENASEGLTFTVSHIVGARSRRTVRLDVSKISSDPFVPSNNKQHTMAAYFVLNTPAVGYTTADITNYAQALITWLSVAANRDKVINGES